MLKFSEPQTRMLRSCQGMNLLMTGTGFGKTKLMALKTGYYLGKCPGISGIITANTHEQLTTSTLVRLREEWLNLFGWKHGRDYVIGIKPPSNFKIVHQIDARGYPGVISFKNGSIAYKASMDNYKAHDGKDVSFSAMDEVKDTKREAVTETVVTRVRKPFMYLDKNGLITTTKTDREFLPMDFYTSPGAVDWLNELFDLDERQEEIHSKIFSETDYYYSEYDNKSVCIASSYHNRENLGKDYFNRVKKTNPLNWKALIYGDPFKKEMDTLFPFFDREKHVGDYAYDEGSHVHVSFDQNYKPYNTSILATLHYEGSKVVLTFFSECLAQPPHSMTEQLCTKLKQEHHSKLMNGITIYGDASARRKTANSGTNTDYVIIKRSLEQYMNNSSDRTARRNPPVAKSVEFVNAIFAGGYENIEIRIDKSCKELISDMQFLRGNSEGGKLIEKDTKTKAEKRGHTSDAMRYMVTTIFSNEFKENYLR